MGSKALAGERLALALAVACLALVPARSSLAAVARQGWSAGTDGTVRYYEADGIPATGERFLTRPDGSGGAWYLFEGADGSMARGWRYLASSGGKWVYYDPGNGAMHHGECYVTGSGGDGWCYFDDVSGATTYGWKYVDAGSKWVYYDPYTGRMWHGEGYVAKDDASTDDPIPGWCYFDDVTGATQYGWKLLRDGRVVYYDPVTGRMWHGSSRIGGATFALDPVTGAASLTDEAVRTGGGWVYGDASGQVSRLSSVVSLDVPYINQDEWGMPCGCEGAALYMALRYKGHLRDMDYAQFMATMPYASDGNPYHGFVGRPDCITGGLDAMLMDPVASWGARYGRTENISGGDEGSLIAELAQGNPVVVWVSAGFRQTYPVDAWYGKSASNWHTMTLMGFDPATDSFQVSDPASSRHQYWVGWDTFSRVWEVLRGAVAVR